MRRGTHDVLARLVADGHSVFLWSGEGIRSSVVRRYQLRDYLSGVFRKPLRDFEAGLRRLRVPVTPDFVIDDFPLIVSHFGGYHIPEFYSAEDDDDELESVYRVVTDLATRGSSTHPRWSPRAAEHSER